MEELKTDQDRYSIALIEPDEQLINVYSRWLEDEGYHVTSYTELQEEVTGFDTVMAEYFDPEQGEVYVDVPEETDLVIISSQDEPEDLEAEKYFRKPVDRDELMEAAKALESGKISRQSAAE